MSLDQLETQVTALRNKAEDARAAWNRTVKDINADETLSATGKRDILADGYSHLKQEIVALHKKESDLVTAKRRTRRPAASQLRLPGGSYRPRPPRSTSAPDVP